MIEHFDQRVTTVLAIACFDSAEHLADTSKRCV